MLMALFDVTTLSPERTSIGFSWCNFVFEQLLLALGDKMSDERNGSVPFKVSDMPVQGLPKLRYVGGWAVRKILETCRKCVHDNVFSSVQKTRERVEANRAKCELPFLDVLIDNNCSHAPITSVYRKKTFTGLLTNYFSFTSYFYKLGLIRTLVDRAYKINSTWVGFHKDIKYLTQILKKNLFPTHLIERVIN